MLTNLLQVKVRTVDVLFFLFFVLLCQVLKFYKLVFIDLSWWLVGNIVDHKKLIPSYHHKTTYHNKTIK
jgi:hypothetical protein